MQDKKSDESVYQQFDYTLHATGRRTQITELNGRVSDYTYDNLYRLTNETITDSVNGNYSASYTFDKVGNRIGSTINGVSTVYTYDANDRLIQEGGERYTYDENGNTLSKTIDSDITTYTYDAKQRLTAASILESGVTKNSSYQYNPDGIRTQKVEEGVITHYLIDTNRDYAQVIAEKDSANAVQVEYVFGDDLLAQNRAGTLSNYHYDGLGSTRALTDSTGEISDSYFYDAFGVELARTGTTVNDYLFTGEQYDSGLGNYYLRARYYDQGIGRFTQQDTFDGWFHEPRSLHKYSYGHQNPVNNIDPSGNLSLSEFGATMRSLGSLATRSMANIGRTALKSMNRSIQNMGSRIKNGLKPKKKPKKKGKNKDEEGNNFQEFQVMLEAKMGAGYIIQPGLGKPPLGDTPRLRALYGDGIYIKMEWKRKVYGGKIIIVHYFKNINTDDNMEFKFKRRK